MDFGVREYQEGGFEVDNLLSDEFTVVTKGDYLEITHWYHLHGTESVMAGFYLVRSSRGVAYGQNGRSWRTPAELALWLLKALAGIPQK